MGSHLPILMKYVGHFAHYPPETPPAHKTPGSAGIDLQAAMPMPVVILPGSRVLIPTGIAVAIEDRNIVGLVCSRSGLALSSGIRVSQGAGVIDSDYREEIGVILQNDDPSNSFTVKPGMRIAQLLFMPVFQVEFRLVEELNTTERTGGFGHTGLEGQ